jgi:hypothetical protein
VAVRDAIGGGAGKGVLVQFPFALVVNKGKQEDVGGAMVVNIWNHTEKDIDEDEAESLRPWSA